MLSRDNRNDKEYATTPQNRSTKYHTRPEGAETLTKHLDHQRRSWKERLSTTTLALARTRISTKPNSLFSRACKNGGRFLDTDETGRMTRIQMNKTRVGAPPICMYSRNCFPQGMKTIANYSDYRSLRDSDDMQVLTIIRVGDRRFPESQNHMEQKDKYKEIQRGEKKATHNSPRASPQLHCTGPGKGTVFMMRLDDQDDCRTDEDGSTDEDEDCSTDEDEDMRIYTTEEVKSEEINLYDTDDKHDAAVKVEKTKKIEVEESQDGKDLDSVGEELEYLEAERREGWEPRCGAGVEEAEEGELNHWNRKSPSLYSESRRDTSPFKYLRQVLESSSLTHQCPRDMTKKQTKAILRSSFSKSRQTDTLKKKHKYLRRSLLRHHDAALLAASSSMVPLLGKVHSNKERGGE